MFPAVPIAPATLPRFSSWFRSAPSTLLFSSATHMGSGSASMRRAISLTVARRRSLLGMGRARTVTARGGALPTMHGACAREHELRPRRARLQPRLLRVAHEPHELAPVVLVHVRDARDHG